MVAAAAALVQKVARLSVEKWPEASQMHARAEQLRLQSEELIEQDAVAYLAFMEAVRSGEGVAGAQARTIQVPLEIARAAAEVAELAEQAGTLGNPKLRPDAVVAVMLAAAAAESAAYLVGMNVGETTDGRWDEARQLASEASARLRSPGARGSSSGPGRGRGRPEGSRRR